MDFFSIASRLQQLDWLSIFIGALLTLVGVFISWKLSQKNKELLVLYSHNVLHSIDLPMLKLFYEDEQIMSLTRLRILFFNNGDKVIDSNDAKIKIEIACGEEIKTLGLTEVDLTERRSIKCHLDKDSKTIKLDFHHLDPKDYLLVDCYISGVESMDPYIRNKGWLKEGDKIDVSEHFLSSIVSLYHSRVRAYFPFWLSGLLIFGYIAFNLIIVEGLSLVMATPLLMLALFFAVLDYIRLDAKNKREIKIYSGIPKKLLKMMDG